MAMVVLLIDGEEYDIERVRDLRKAAAKCEEASRLHAHGALPAKILRRAARALRKAAFEEEQLGKLLRD